jgi:hypothetical protein
MVISLRRMQERVQIGTAGPYVRCEVFASHSHILSSSNMTGRRQAPQRPHQAL